MTQEIYLVMAITGEYEDYRRNPVHGWSDKAVAEHSIVILTAEQIAWNDFALIYREYEKVYETANPEPEYPRDKVKERPRWPKGLGKDQITQEMIQARQDVDNHNAKLIDDFSALMDEYSNKQREVTLAHFTALGIYEKYLPAITNGTYISTTDIRYEIQPISID